MRISPPFKKLMIKEFRYAAKKMKEEDNPFKKAYFFSATYGIVSRIFNIEFDPFLVLMHTVLNAAHATLDARLSALLQKSDMAVELPEKLFDRLAEAVKELAIKIEQDKAAFEPLQDIANLAYSTTGNGYYLYQKGVLRV